MSDEFDYDQDSEEVLQREPNALAVPVRVVEQPSERKPAIGGVDWSQDVTDTRVEPLVDGDPRRSKVVIFAIGQAIYLGKDQNTVAKTGAGILPAGSSITLTHRDPLFARVVAAGQTGQVSVYVERWSD